MTLSLSLGLTIGGNGGGSAPFIPTQPQLVATYCGIPNGSFVQMGTGNVRGLGRSGHRSGGVLARNLQILDSLILLGTNGAESTSATLNTLQRAIEISGVTTRALYSAANSIGISGSTQALSDIIGSLELPPDTDFFTRWEKALPADTNSLIGHALVGPSGQGFRTSGASQLMGTGVLNSSGTSAGPQIWPNGILGVPDSPMSAVCIVGDSIGNYREDANTAAGGGAWVRALNNINGSGRAVPWMKQTQNGHTFGNASFGSAPLQKTQWQYVTDIFIELSTNSMPSSGTVAERLLSLQNGWLNLANGARAITGPYGRRLRVHFFDMIKRDTFDATQESTRLAYNAWGASFADGKADAYCNTDSVVTSPVGADGIHPASSVHIAMAPVIVAGYTPFLDPFYFPFGV